MSVQERAQGEQERSTILRTTWLQHDRSASATAAHVQRLTRRVAAQLRDATPRLLYPNLRSPTMFDHDIAYLPLQAGVP
jgi:hypothetical protein